MLVAAALSNCAGGWHWPRLYDLLSLPPAPTQQTGDSGLKGGIPVVLTSIQRKSQRGMERDHTSNIPCQIISLQPRRQCSQNMYWPRNPTMSKEWYPRVYCLVQCILLLCFKDRLIQLEGFSGHVRRFGTGQCVCRMRPGGCFPYSAFWPSLLKSLRDSHETDWLPHLNHHAFSFGFFWGHPLSLSGP